MSTNFISKTTGILLLVASHSLFAGSLDSPAAVTNVGSAMNTVEDIYNRLDTGTTGNAPTAGFTEPAAGPGATGRTLTEVMGKAPVVDDVNGATAADVATGKTFWGLKSGGDWGVKTGSAYPAPVAKTGQTKCYNTVGTEISCVGTGQDGELQKGKDIASGSRFTDNNGTVTDNRTGLIWLKNTTCWTPSNWQIALDNSNTLASGSCGLSDNSNAGDWRLPNVAELFSLIDWQNSGLSSLPTGHPFTPFLGTSYWSSNTMIPNTNNAWRVDVGDTGSGFGVVAQGKGIFNAGWTWPVRGGQ